MFYERLSSMKALDEMTRILDLPLYITSSAAVEAALLAFSPTLLCNAV